MLVPKMNIDEIYNEIIKNYNFIVNKTLNIKSKLERIATKSKTSVSKFIFTKDKNNNDWFIFLNVTKKYYGIIFGVLYLDDNNKFNVITICKNKSFLCHYTSHFFDRYNERHLKQNLSKKQILEAFIINNPSIAININNDNPINVFNTGIGLGLFQNNTNTNFSIFYNKTFVSNDMLFDNQNEISEIGKKLSKDNLNDIIKSKNQKNLLLPLYNQ
jgi:hypothetical protein